jgi:hypothetical protein
VKKLFAFALTALMAAVLVSAPTGCSDKKTETKKDEKTTKTTTEETKTETPKK